MVAVGVIVEVAVIVAVKIMVGGGGGVVVVSLTGIGESWGGWVGVLGFATEGDGEGEVDVKLEFGMLQPLSVMTNATDRPASVLSG